MNKRDASALRHVIGYCSEIQELVQRFGATLEALQADIAYRHSVSLCVLQIGELTTHLSDEFKQTYDAMPWQDIKLMRNIVAHRYGKFETGQLFDTIMNDIPQLQNYCKNILRENEQS